MIDPLVQQVFLNASARQSRANRESRELQKYKQARAVKERPQDSRKMPWNRIGPMRLYLCDSVREQLQKAIQAEADQAYKERYGDTL